MSRPRWPTARPRPRRRAVEVALARPRHRLPLVAAPAVPARSTIPTRSSWSARPGSWPSGDTGRRARLAATATGHADARCREAAVAALGAIGDPAGLPAVLTALTDSPTVRRRATVALAGFDDPRVTPALRAATGTATGRCARPPASCSTIRP